VSSITRRPNGHRWITYKFNKKRHTLRLGKVPDELAAEIKRRLDVLIEHATVGLEPPAEIAAWLSKIDERFHKSLETAGLTTSRGPSTLHELIEAHEESLRARGSKPSTMVNNCVVYGNLLKFFKHARHIRSIHLQHAEQFRLFLINKGGRSEGPLAKATVSNRCRRARAIFAYAIKNKWLDQNPFVSITTGREWNYARDHYILPEIFEKILDQSADHELRLLLAMVRYCGLRCPSEVRPLTWQAVDWKNNVLVVHSSKTELYGDSGRREVPIFPPVTPYLHAAWDAAPKGEMLMFPSHQGSGAAITGRLASLCRKAGEVLWPKAMVNLRASAVSDAMRAYQDIYMVAPWFGHSPIISLQHYNRVVKERHVRTAYNALHPDDPAKAIVPIATRHSDPSRTATD
jgi:integrase